VYGVSEGSGPAPERRRPARPAAAQGSVDFARESSGSARDDPRMPQFRFAVSAAACVAPAAPRISDGDGEVDGADLGYLLSNWGPCAL